MIKSIFCLKNSSAIKLKPEDLEDAAIEHGLIWIDIEKPTQQDFNELSKIFQLHKIAISDCLHTTKRPKSNEFKNHISTILFSINYENNTIFSHQLNLLLGKNFLITSHKIPIKQLELTHNFFTNNPLQFKDRPDYLAYYIIEQVIDNYFTILDKLDDYIYSLENEVFSNPSNKSIRNVFSTKRSVIMLRRIISPTRDTINILSHRDNPFISSDARLYFRDLYDRIINLNDSIETFRDLLIGILEAYLSIISNRLNEVMKVLTVFATIMMPLTLITGIYGMNFLYMPEIHSPFGQKYGYFMVLGIMVSISIVMLL